MKQKKVIAGAIVMLQLVSSQVSAKEIPAKIPDDRAIKAIIGEGEDQGAQGMFALACAIRNRGTLKGVYGYHAITEVNGKFVRITRKGTRVISPAIVEQAKAAWEKSLTKRLHSGTMWENIQAFGIPYWAKNLKPVAVIGDHTFYREGLYA